MRFICSDRFEFPLIREKLKTIKTIDMIELNFHFEHMSILNLVRCYYRYESKQINIKFDMHRYEQ
jgi:hypothetical protein